MIKTYLILVLGLGLSLTLQSQQLPVFSQHSEQFAYSNPAHLGYQYLIRDNDLTVSALYAKQWTQQKNGPESQFINFAYTNKYDNAMHPIFGGSIINDNTGPLSYTGIYGRVGAVYSPDPDAFGISIALSGGALNYRVDASKIFLREEGDILGTSDQSIWSPDINMGVFVYKGLGYRDETIIYLGLAADQLFGTELKFEENGENFSYNRVRHFNAEVGSYFNLTDEALLHPRVSMKYIIDSPPSLGLSLEYIYDNMFNIQAAYFSGQELGLGTGINMGEAWDWGFDCFINYSFGYPLTEYAPNFGSAHVIGISYGIDTN